MATNIGMMDSAYFVGRNEILTWINDRLQLNLSRVEEVCVIGVLCCISACGAFSNSYMVMLIWFICSGIRVLELGQENADVGLNLFPRGVSKVLGLLGNGSD